MVLSAPVAITTNGHAQEPPPTPGAPGEQTEPATDDGAQVDIPAMRAGLGELSGLMVQVGRTGYKHPELVPEIVPKIAEFLSYPSPHVRAIAADHLGNLGPPAKAATPALVQSLRDTDKRVRRKSAEALGRIGPEAKSAIPALKGLLNDRFVRFAAAEAIWNVSRDADAVVPTLAALVDGESSFTADKAALLLFRIDQDHPAVIPGLIHALEGHPSFHPRRAASCLGSLGPGAREAVPALRKVYQQAPNESIAKACQGALKSIQGVDPPEIYYHDSAVYLVKADGSEFRRVARDDAYQWHARPVISPSGNRIAWEAHRSGLKSPSVLVADLDGNVTQKIDGATRPAWLSDTVLLTELRGSVVKVDLNAGLKQESLFRGSPLALSANRRYLVFARGSSRFVCELESDEQRKLWLHFPSKHGVAVSNDGARVAFVGLAPRGEGIFFSDGQVGKIADEPGAEYSPRFSPDGTRLMFAAGSTALGPDAPANRIYIVDLASGISKAMTDDKFHCRDGSWSSDGETVVLVAVKVAEAAKKLEAELHLERATALRHDGEFDQAIKECRSAIEIYPRLPRAHVVMGDCLRKVNRIDEAMVAFHAAARVDPNNIEAQRSLAAAYKKQQHWSEARVALRRMTEINPTDPRSWSDLIDVTWWDDTSNDRSVDAAMKVYDEAKAALPDSRILEVTLVHAAWCLWVGRYEEYANLCRAAAAEHLDSTFYYSQYLLARLLALSHEPVVVPGTLVDIATKAVAGVSNDDWLYRYRGALAICLVRDGQTDAAIEQFGQDELGVALAYAVAGKRDLAEESFRRAQKQLLNDPLDPRSTLPPHDRLTRQLYVREIEQRLKSK